MTTFSFKTIGCRLNQAETAAMRALVADAGGRIVEFGEPCDICVIHGCVVTARAEKNTWRLARAARLAGRAAQVAVAGCPAELAVRQGRPAGAVRLIRQADKLDAARLWQALGLPAGRDAEHRSAATGMPDAEHRSAATGMPPDTRALVHVQDAGRAKSPSELQNGSVGDVALPPADSPGRARSPLRAVRGTRALVRAQDGCDFRCAYCIVPFTRGAPRSRPLPEITDEIRRLAESGCREIVLTGANLGCYAWQGLRLKHLLEAIARQTGIRRLRLSSIELSTAEREVIDCMADNPVICRFLHLPLQSGSDAVLRAMRRRYDRRRYMAAVEYAQRKLGAFGLGADVIAGFPGETDADFEDTMRLVRDLPFSNLHVFVYSPRPGTPAAAMPDQVPAPVKQARAARLRDLGGAQRAAFAREWVGRPVEVLTEHTPPDSPEAAGWTGEYLYARIPPGLAGKLPPNRIVKCKPRGAVGGILLDCEILPA